MRKIIVTEFMTIDGVVESPEKWSFPYWNSETENFKNEELAETGALLLGRQTFDGFAAAWPGRTGDYADRFNALPKYVASSKPLSSIWSGSELLQGRLSDALTHLKNTKGNDIVLHGSVALAQSLIDNKLVDQFNLLVYPVILGAGKRLFREGQQAKLKLVESKTFSTGVVALTYHRDA